MKLKVYLADIEMSMKEFAELLGYDKGYMSLVAGGHIAPSIRLAIAIKEITEGAVVIPPSMKTKRAKMLWQRAA